MRGPTGRRPQTTTPTPLDPWQFPTISRRDSDASFCSSRPSSAHSTRPIPTTTDRSHQLHSISTINSYLSTSPLQITFKLKPLPSNKDILETLKYILTRLDYPINNNNKFEDDLFTVLKCLNCPVKINKSALKAPGTPHSFPSVLAVLHWLVQLAMFNEYLAGSGLGLGFGDSMFEYSLKCYLHYIGGDDDAVEHEDEEFIGKLKQFPTISRRDSDASFCSSRPSSAHSTRPIPTTTDRSHQLHAISTINSYLSTSPLQITFKLKPLPSNKDILETLKYILTRLDYPINNTNNKFEDDLFTVLKCLNCPVKINKSALKAPGTPHSFPSVLAVLHWLVQLAMFNEYLAGSGLGLGFGDSMFEYSLKCYLHYIGGDDDAVEHEDEEFIGKLKQEKDAMLENVNVLSENAKDLEAKLEAMKAGPSLKEAKEEEKSMLEKDMKKFNDLIEQLKVHEVNVEKQMEEKEKELRIKVEERNRICVENEELKKKVEEQAINMRDAERMKRELQSVERDIRDAEDERTKWEEKCWDLNAVIGTKFKELEALQTECNHAIRRLKLGNDIQYELNAKGTTPAEVLGMDYKSRLVPVLNSLRDEVKGSSMENLETLMSLQQLSRDIAAKIDAKRNRISVLQSRIEEVENQLNSIQNETQVHTSRCAMEARQLVNNFEVESRKVELVEKEAHEFVESSKAKLQETIKQCEEEVEMCAHELLALIDSVSKYKEFTVCKISEWNDAIAETAAAVAQVHKDALKSSLGI